LLSMGNQDFKCKNKPILKLFHNFRILERVKTSNLREKLINI
jgi:hypothetical protein